MHERSKENSANLRLIKFATEAAALHIFVKI